MRIAINATCINFVESGAKNRFSVVYNALISQNPSLIFYILEPKDCDLKNIINPSKNLIFIKTKCLSYNSIQRYIIGKLTIPKIVKDIQANIYEQSHLPLIHIPNVKTIFTIHDIRYSIKKNNFINIFRSSFFSDFFLKKAVINSNKIITVSKTIKDEIKNKYNNNKTVVIYNPLKFNKMNTAKKENFSNLAYFSKNKFCLSVGSFEKRKNYLTVLYAAYLLKNLNIDINFCLVGYQTSYLKVIKKKIKDLNLSNIVHIYHNLPNKELSYLYQNCSLFLYPSKYEGFGIPLIEAIHFNCNIIFSNIKIFSEITESQGVTFNPDSPEDLCNEILNCIKGNQYSKIDIEKLDKFNLNKITDSILELY